MSDAKTLFELTGSSHPAAELKQATLLIIDAQNEYRNGDLRLPGVEAAAEQIHRLLAAARAAGTPVVHVQHIGVPGYLFDPEGPRGDIFAELTPLAGEALVRKPLPNSFARSELDRVLRELGREELVVVGFMTHMCVSATVRAAKDLGYRSTVVAAACATRDLPGVDGVTVDAATLHRVELAALADLFATVVADAAALGA